jgi:hypothetical protein
MPNLRIIYDNAADRAVLTASSTAGALVVANLQADGKGSVWRSTAKTASISAVWAQPEVLAGAALPFCNLSSTATIRVRGYTDAAGTVLAFDTGAVLACAYAPLGMSTWGMPLGVNAFTFGGGTYARAWFAPVLVRKIVIDLADADNAASYLEAARLVVGASWSPKYNADYGASVTPEDASQHYRTDGGSLLTEVGARYRKLSIQLSHLTPLDRAEFWRIVRGNGKSRPMFVSLYPESADPELEQANQVYGKLPNIPTISTPFFNTYSAPCEIEEI